MIHAPFTVTDIQSAIEQGREAERAKIIEQIENAPVAFDFFGPYISRDKLMEFLKGEK